MVFRFGLQTQIIGMGFMPTEHMNKLVLSFFRVALLAITTPIVVGFALKMALAHHGQATLVIFVQLAGAGVAQVNLVDQLVADVRELVLDA